MDYEGQICRGPMERGAFMLPVTVGCPYNKCKFCDLFMHLKYREISPEDIEEELARVRKIGGHPKTVYLGDGNAFVLKTDRLLEIIDMIRHYFPEVKEIHSDATVTSIRLKSDEELKRLSDAGYNKLYIGIESALQDVLAFMNKDHSVSQAYEAIDRIHAAGMGYAAHIMTGVAGAGRSMEAAQAMAEFLTGTQPENVVNFSMFLSGRLLKREIESGRFVPATEVENLREEKRIIELLNVPADRPMKWDGFHDWLHIRTYGKLPKDKDRILAKLSRAIAENENKPDVYSMYTGTSADDGYGFENPDYPALQDVYIKDGKTSA